jgi:hypothetical protein
LANTGITLALEEIGSRFFFDEMRTESDLSITSSASYVALPSGFVQAVEARLISGTTTYPFEIHTKTWMVERWSMTTTSTGIPVRGYVEGGNLKFLPISNGTYTLRLTWVALPTLTSDSSSNPIPGSDECVISYALHWLFKSLQMTDSAREWLLNFERKLQSLISLRERKGVKRVAEGFSPEAPLVEKDPFTDPFAGLNRRPYG